MIRVIPAPEPAAFDETVRKRGLRAIAEMVGEKPPRAAGRRFTKLADERGLIPPNSFPPFWTEALDDLKTAYSFICAYSCFRIHEVTGAASVDHMVAKSKAWDRVYEWDNYRLACSRLNSRKNDFFDVLDPFDVQDDWFHLELVGFQVQPNSDIADSAIRTKIQNTIDRLRLNDSILLNRRISDAELYWSGDISLKHLERESPFVARELRRQRRLHSADV